MAKISTHAPLAGRDADIAALTGERLAFQPTRPLRGATKLVIELAQLTRISTHAPLAGRDMSCWRLPK